MLSLKINFENRVFGLDLIRAFAILMVVYIHGQNFLSPIIDVKIYENFYVDGVTIFFVLSGFLIGNIYIKGINEEGVENFSMLNFWKRRWFRTFPNYFLMLTFLVVYFDLMHHYSYKHSIKYFFFIQSIVDEHPVFFGEAWSLAVEEWFYLLLPLLFYIFYKFIFHDIKISFLRLIVLLIVLPIIARVVLHFFIHPCNAYTYDFYFRKLVFLRFDSIMLGVLGAYCKNEYNAIWERCKTYWWMGILLVFIMHIIYINRDFDNVYYCFFMRTFHILFFAIGVLLTIPFFASYHPKKLNFFHKILMFISIISYSMYLINLTLFKSIFGPLFNKFFVIL